MFKYTPTETTEAPLTGGTIYNAPLPGICPGCGRCHTCGRPNTLNPCLPPQPWGGTVVGPGYVQNGTLVIRESGSISPR